MIDMSPKSIDSGVTLYALKPRLVIALESLIGSLARRRVPPNAVTIAAIPVVVLTATCLAAGASIPGLWLAVPVLSALWMTLNAVDGALARREGTETRAGALLNELVDRLGDVAVLGSGLLVTNRAAYALIAVLCSELVALIGWGVLGERVLLGVMGKPDRAAVLSVGAFAAYFVGQEVLEAAFVLIAIGAVVGTGQRVAVAAAMANTRDRSGRDAT